MRLIYYLSPMDLIQHHAQSQFSSTYKVVESSYLSVDDLVEHELGAYCTISLHSRRKSATDGGGDAIEEAAIEMEESTGDNTNNTDGGGKQHHRHHHHHHRLADTTTLVLSENQDDRVWHEYLSPYLNFNFDFERMPLFVANNKQNNKSQQQHSSSGVKVPGCFVLRLNKPVVMCVSTLEELQQRIGE